MNLVVNARDAMSGGGKIILSTSREWIDGRDQRPGSVAAGEYSVLAVADNGCGMSDEVRARVFEAFFTTKPAGLGTGLGLATCRSIVQRWRGHITVESAVGAGTTFKIYLPGAVRAAEGCAAPSKSGVLPRGTETVLVVEDEPGLRELASLVLEAQGYTVLKAGNGQEALGMVREQSGLPVDLVITDMVMPEMGGKVMAAWLRAANPESKILFTSGWDRVSSQALYASQAGAASTGGDRRDRPHRRRKIIGQSLCPPRRTARLRRLKMAKVELEGIAGSNPVTPIFQKGGRPPLTRGSLAAGRARRRAGSLPPDGGDSGPR